jgi:hypothetical protein
VTKFEKEVLQALKEIKEAIQALRVQPQIVFVPSPYAPVAATPVIPNTIPRPYIGDPPGWLGGTTISCEGTNSSKIQTLQRHDL